MFTAVPPEERLLAELADIAGRHQELADRLARHAIICAYPNIASGLAALAARQAEHARALHVLLRERNVWSKLPRPMEAEGSSNWARVTGDLEIMLEELFGGADHCGFPMTVYDLNEKNVEALVQLGASAAPNPEQLARDVEVVLSCLPDESAVEAVYLGERQRFAKLTPGHAHHRAEHELPGDGQEIILNGAAVWHSRVGCRRLGQFTRR